MGMEIALGGKCAEESELFFSIIVPNSGEGRENRPQLRCGNTPVQSPILPVMAGA